MGHGPQEGGEGPRGDPADLYDGPPLWAFFPAEKKWKAFKAPKPYPVAIFGGMLEYVPELGGTVWDANNWQMHGTWLHDFDKTAWTKPAPEGDPLPTGGKRLASVDPSLNAVVVIDGTTLWAYRYRAV